MNTKELIEIVSDMIDNDCKVIAGEKGFWYDQKENQITLGLNESYMDNLDWKLFLKNEYNFQLTRENWFTLSVLHELGHHYTIEYFTTEEWNESQHDYEDVNDHFNELVEKVATEWAIEYYNMVDIDFWNKKITNALR